MFANPVAFDSAAPVRGSILVAPRRVLSLGWRLGIALVLPVFTRAQSAESRPPPADYSAKSWLVEDGLPHNVVNRIVQDGRGFLWVGTAGGLARFDGREFREFPISMAPLDAGLNIR